MAEILEFLRAAIELLLVGLGHLRFVIRRSRSRSCWPEIAGIVQYCGPERDSLFGRHYIVFGYAFKANGRRYAGFFALATDQGDSAATFQKQATGITVRVRYKPDNPDVSLLEDEQVLGRKIIQNPHLARIQFSANRFN